MTKESKTSGKKEEARYRNWPWCWNSFSKNMSKKEKTKMLLI